jgi:hypothetical protein
VRLGVREQDRVAVDDGGVRRDHVEDPGAQCAVIKATTCGIGFQAGQYFARAEVQGQRRRDPWRRRISMANQRTKGFADAIAPYKGRIKIIA